MVGVRAPPLRFTEGAINGVFRETMRLRTPSSPLFGLGRIIYFIFFFVTWIAIVLQFCRGLRRNRVRIGRGLDRRWRAIFGLAWRIRITVFFHGLFLSTWPGRATAGRVFLCGSCFPGWALQFRSAGSGQAA